MRQRGTWSLSFYLWQVEVDWNNNTTNGLHRQAEIDGEFLYVSIGRNLSYRNATDERRSGNRAVISIRTKSVKNHLKNTHRVPIPYFICDYKSTMTEVGVSLALRQKKNLLDKRLKRKERPLQGEVLPRKKIVSTKLLNSKEVTQNSSFQIFIEGAALYTLCLILPKLFGLLTGFINKFLEHHSQQNYFSGAIAPDAGISDVAIVGFLSLSMAIIRLMLVHFLVPGYDQPHRMKAFVRCKSVHLLSSHYTGNGTPKINKRKVALQMNDTTDAALLPPLPFLPDSDVNNDDHSHCRLEFKSKSSLSHNQELNHNMNDEDDNEDLFVVSSGLISSSSAVSLQALLQHSTPMLEAQITPRRRKKESISHKEEEQQQSQPDAVEIGIFTAPKFATAVFRLFYSTLSCTIALYYFLDANFWPPAVGGKGNSKNCWDLSSVGATEFLDSDFDQHNTALRRYFLLQASYHFHSGAFHIFTALLLWFVSSSSSSKQQPNKDDTNRFVFGFVPAGMITINNIKTLFQHCFAVCLITFIYLFSSLRRLGTIAMFSFDFSSWSLHLLQLCINDSSKRTSPRSIRLLHKLVVIPLFCYSRFYIFPFVIGYSALEESQDWLKQLENMLVPGVARSVDGVFVISFCLIMIMNLVYFQRLLNHPHVSQSLH